MKRNLLAICAISTMSSLAIYPLTTHAKEDGLKHRMYRENTICFIENAGQIVDQNHKSRKDIDFKLNANDITIFIGDGQMHYQWFRPIASGDKINLTASKDVPKELTKYEMCGMDVELIGANKNAAYSTLNPGVYREFYYNNDVPRGTVAKSYGKVIYKNVYPHIDWVLYTASDAKAIKYDFIVHQGGNASDIKLKYKGATSLKVADGVFTATTSLGTVTEARPYTYDAATGRVISSNYVLEGDVLRFAINGSAQNMVIDPQINWSTYYANPDQGFTYGLTTAADSAGNSYMCGSTNMSTNMSISYPLFPVSGNSCYQYTYGGGNLDGYIVKFNAAGQREWATFYGGSDLDQINAATCDVNGNLLVTGYSNSVSGMGSSGAYKQYNSGNGNPGTSWTDVFIGKFSPSGPLIWGTYYGHVQSEIAYSICSDKYGDIFIGGTTSSSSSIATTGAYNTTPADGFITKFSSSGSLLWGTYFKGIVNAVTCDYVGKVYAAGYTSQTSGVATSGSHLSTFAGGAQDGFIASFTSTGSIRWSTYYGGNGFDNINALALDFYGNLYAVGSTLCTSGIATTGGFRPNHSGAPSPYAMDGFITKFDSFGVRQWGTYYGAASGIDNIFSINFAPDGKFFIAGTTGSLSDIATSNAWHSVNYGPPPPIPSTPIVYQDNDVFIAKFNQDGNRLWGSYFGGDKVESTPTVAYGGGSIFLGGSTQSWRYVTTSGSLQEVMVDTVHSVVLPYMAKFADDTAVYIRLPYIDSMLCAGDSLFVKYGTINKFRPSSNTFSVQLSNATGSFASPVTIGTKADSLGGIVRCRIPLSTAQGTGYRIRIISTAPTDTFYNYNINIRISQYPNPDAVAITPVCNNSPLQVADNNAPQPSGTQYSWIPPNSARIGGGGTTYTISSCTYADSGDYYIVENNYGCIKRDTVHVTVQPSPANPVIVGDTSLCIGDTLTLTANSITAGVSYQWLGKKLQVPTTQDFVLPNADTSDAGNYKVAVILNGCASAFVTRGVTVHPYPKPTASSNSPACIEASLDLHGADTITTGLSYYWIGPGSFTSYHKDTSIVNPTMGAAGTYMLITTTIHGCADTATTIVSIHQKPHADSIDAGPTSTYSYNFSIANPQNIITLNWDFGDGGTDNSNTPSHTYTTTGVYTVRLIITNDCGSDTLYKTVYAAVAGIGSYTTNNKLLHVYPNPASEHITVESPYTINKIMLYSVIGVKVSEAIVDGKRYTMDIKGLASGTYLMNIETANGKFVQKVDIK
ncbi:MAG: PKD domain-containing protein [Bacteroidetes bacterium]|nr:PKD domain-containing protein [Bacteroidota bacterium]